MRLTISFVNSATCAIALCCLQSSAEDVDSASNAVAIKSFLEKSTNDDGVDFEKQAVQPQTELPIKYLGNSSSAKFHRPSCPFARAMNARHVVMFHFRHEAVEAGQHPCRYCLPPVVQRVECKIIAHNKAQNNEAIEIKPVELAKAPCNVGHDVKAIKVELDAK